MKETITKINKTKSWLLKKINKIDKLKKKIKKQRENTLINKIRNEKGKITKDNAKIHRIIRGVGWDGRWEGGSTEREICIPTADSR